MFVLKIAKKNPSVAWWDCCGVRMRKFIFILVLATERVSKFIPEFIMDVITQFMEGLKLNYVSEMGPWYYVTDMYWFKPIAHCIVSVAHWVRYVDMVSVVSQMSVLLFHWAHWICNT